VPQKENKRTAIPPAILYTAELAPRRWRPGGLDVSDSTESGRNRAAVCSTTLYPFAVSPYHFFLWQNQGYEARCKSRLRIYNSCERLRRRSKLGRQVIAPLPGYRSRAPPTRALFWGSSSAKSSDESAQILVERRSLYATFPKMVANLRGLHRSVDSNHSPGRAVRAWVAGLAGCRVARALGPDSPSPRTGVGRNSTWLGCLGCGIVELPFGR
jgi:hypothetical protein